VTFPGSIPAESTEFAVSVRADGVPVPGILVCVSKDDEVYETALTDAGGEATLWPAPVTPGAMEVTFSGHGYLPLEDSAEVLTPEDPVIIYLMHEIDDSGGGNGDGMAGAGETIDMTVRVRNVGSGTSFNAVGVLRTDDSLAALTDSVVTFGDILPADTAVGVSGLTFSVDPGCPNGHDLEFRLVVTDDSLNEWTLVFHEEVVTPVLSYLAYSVEDATGGDGNHQIDPDETVDLDVTLRNTGLADGRDVRGVIGTVDPYLDLLVDTADFSLIPASGVGTTVIPFTVHVHGDCPVPHFPVISIDLEDGFGYSTSDTFELVVGTTGFSSNIDSIEGWDHFSCSGGYDDEWHHSTERYHSEDYSWKCGTVGDDYSDRLDACLETPEFLLGPNSELFFFHWIEAETADGEVDQCYDAGIVEIQVDSGPFEYIEPEGGYPFFIKEGSEHPFPGILGYSGVRDWEPATFDLSGYTGMARIRFRFGSDRSVSKEGWYVDDVSVQSLASPDIDLSPWAFSVTLDSGDSSGELLTVKNTGSAPLSFTVSLQEDSARQGSWLSVSPDSGTVGPDSSAGITLTIDATGLTDGVYLEEIRIASNDPDEPWLLVPVELTVTGGICGDANGDGAVTSGDGYTILNYFGSGPEPVSCWAANVNGDGGLTTGDGYYVLNYLGVGPDLDCAPCDLSEVEFIREDIVE
jgi:hypothetical protein